MKTVMLPLSSYKSVDYAKTLRASFSRRAFHLRPPTVIRPRVRMVQEARKTEERKAT